MLKPQINQIFEESNQIYGAKREYLKQVRFEKKHNLLINNFVADSPTKPNMVLRFYKLSLKR
jgi:hypothetical protein